MLLVLAEAQSRMLRPQLIENEDSMAVVTPPNPRRPAIPRTIRAAAIDRLAPRQPLPSTPCQSGNPGRGEILIAVHAAESKTGG